MPAGVSLDNVTIQFYPWQTGKITGVDVRHIYQATKNESAAVKQILKLAKKTEEKGEKKISLKDLEFDAAYNVEKDTAAVKKLLSEVVNLVF